jgi:flagellar hook-basal body complex protein FliE
MSTLPLSAITPSGAAAAYGRVQRGDVGSGANADAFAATLRRAVESAVQTGHQAETQAVQAINGNGNLTEVVTALAQAELTLQTASAVRDRVVQAYQDIIRMPI